ncbi:MAG TPA: hypothetical protein ENH82_18535 [bacterium]|nr:hypothetical protein [bacterium]
MITSEQREQRRKHIGSSDISAIMGVNPFMNAYEVYLSKIHEMDDYVPSESAEIGNYLEDDIVEWVAKKYKVNCITEPNHLWFNSKEHPLFACNIDAFINHDNRFDVSAIEVKYTSLIDEWGTGEETIPDHFMLQVQHQMLCTGFDYIIVGVWIAYYGIERRHYVIKRNQKMIDRIVSYGEWWWNTHVIPKVPPKDSPLPIPKEFSRIKKVEGKIIDISSESWTAFTEAKETERIAKKAKDTAMSKVRAELGDAQAGRVPGEENTFYGTINGKTRTFKGDNNG